jgi:hypothetical protein
VCAKIEPETIVSARISLPSIPCRTGKTFRARIFMPPACNRWFGSVTPENRRNGTLGHKYSIAAQKARSGWKKFSPEGNTAFSPCSILWALRRYRLHLRPFYCSGFGVW